MGLCSLVMRGGGSAGTGSPTKGQGVGKAGWLLVLIALAAEMMVPHGLHEAKEHSVAFLRRKSILFIVTFYGKGYISMYEGAVPYFPAKGGAGLLAALGRAVLLREANPRSSLGRLPAGTPGQWCLQLHPYMATGLSCLPAGGCSNRGISGSHWTLHTWLPLQQEQSSCSLGGLGGQ